MLEINPKYITDNKGKKIAVVIPIKDYKAIMEELEELYDIKLYDDATKANEPSVPIDKAFKMIEAKRSMK